MAGFPITALKMAILNTLGLSPKTCYPMATGASALTLAFGAIAFIKHDAYYRKLTLISTTIGSFGGLIAVFTVSQLDTTILRWGIAILALHAGITSLTKEIRNKSQ